MATVYWDVKILKDGSRRYYVRSKVRDVRRSHGSCRTLREAQTLKGEILKSIANKSYWETPKKQTTLHESYQQWIKSKSNTVRPGTLTDYELTFRLHILPVLGDKKLSDITPGDVQAWVDSLSDKQLSPASINKAYRYLKNLLNKAVSNEEIDRTPCHDLDVPSGTRRTVSDILRLEEVQKVLEVADESLRPLVAVLAYGGLRIGEALGLRWKDIDFEARCIRIEETWTKNNTWSTPKSSAGRRAVPMTPRLGAILNDAYNKSGCPSPETVIFSGDGKRPYDRSNVRRKFNKALNKAGVRHVRIHDCRHTYSTNMLACGCSIKALQNALGHSTATLTLDTYSHYFAESAAEAVSRFDELVSRSDVTNSDPK